MSTKRSRRGGAAIAAGGFGCVFSPALACDGKGTTNKKNLISKLMSTSHADEEYHEINGIRAKLQGLPDLEDFFLLHDLTLCRPAKLSTADLKNFGTTCKSLVNSQITASNVNSKLGDLRVLTMPNGGKAIDDLMYQQKSSRILLGMHRKLVELLQKAVVPMNARHVFHNDIKDSNVLVQLSTTSSEDDMKTRLIDWGLSAQYVPHKNQPFPSAWRNRPLQFNVPFSVILFSDEFVNRYSAYLKTGGSSTDETELRPFVVDYLRFWMQERGPGHYKFINEIFFMLFSHSVTGVEQQANLANVVETEFTLKYLVNYLIHVLQHFTVLDAKGKFSVRPYLDDCFVKIVDIWGFVSIYFCYLELLFNNYDNLNPTERQLFDAFRQLFLTYCFEPRHQPVVISRLVRDLQHITGLLETIAAHGTPTSVISHVSTVRTHKSMRKTIKKTKVKVRSKKPTQQKSALSSAATYKKRPKLGRFKNPLFLR